jgi:hypothetical protein
MENCLRSTLLCGACIATFTAAPACGSDATIIGNVAPLVDVADDVTYPRYVDAKGAFTCDLTLVGNYPQARVPPDLERDRMVMSREPGMLVKYLPLAFDPEGTTEGQPNLLSGGRYLFEDADKAASYRNFVENVFTLDGVQFLDREIFLESECHDYKVVSAYELTPLHDTHVLVRTERFAMSGDKPVKKLKALWPALQAEATDRGMAAVWLLYNERESIASVVYLHDRIVPYDPNVPDFASLGYLAAAEPLGHGLAELGWTRTFDRTHWILTIWHPFERGDQGEPSDWPHSPPFPAPSCGDGVCEVSRGEAAVSCSADCPEACGNGRCQPAQGEDDHNCPGDCG